jgi:hypothetical protein
MTHLTQSWYFRTLTGRLATALAVAIVIAGIAVGTSIGLVVALRAEHQSQAICGLAGDVARTPVVNVTPPVSRTGLSFIKDARNAYHTGNCEAVDGSLPSPAPPLKSAFPGIK